MAKREISSTLKNLKFMQRAAQRDEKKEAEAVIPNGNLSGSCILKKCVVIMEGDPHPGQSRGRMSFQRFNPSLDKLNEDANSPSQPESSTTRSDNQNGKFSAREDEATGDGYDGLDLNGSGNSSSGDLKRKQLEETPSPNKSKKNKVKKHRFQINQEAHRGSRKYGKQPKGQKLDWSVLRPPKCQKKTV